MRQLAFLYACYRLGAHYHSGQWSPGYRLMCEASTYARREYGIDLGSMWEKIDNHSPIVAPQFRRVLAAVMLKMRRHRFKL